MEVTMPSKARPVGTRLLSPGKAGEPTLVVNISMEKHIFEFEFGGPILPMCFGVHGWGLAYISWGLRALGGGGHST